MESNGNFAKIYISGGNTFITENENDAYRIEEGNILVFITPWENGAPGRRLFLYKAGTGEIIPSFCFRDADYQYWRFCFVAEEAAQLTVLKESVTGVLKERFASKIGKINYEADGFENGIVDYYKTNIVKEDSFIHKTRQDKLQTKENSLNLIHNVIKKAKRKVEEKGRSNNLYNAMQYLCAKQGIPIADYDKTDECCDHKFDVQGIARVSHFSYREVTLEENWHKEDSGPLMVFDEETGKPYACIPNGAKGYRIYDPETGQTEKLSKSTADKMKLKGYVIYRPFPSKSLSKKDVINFALKSIPKGDVVRLCIMTAISAAIGLLLPKLNQLIYENI